MNSTLSTAFKEMNLNEKKNRINKVFSCRFPFSLLSVGATIQTMHEYHPRSSCLIVQMLLINVNIEAFVRCIYHEFFKRFYFQWPITFNSEPVFSVQTIFIKRVTLCARCCSGELHVCNVRTYGIERTNLKCFDHGIFSLE